jgi:dTDP-4-dehydrorhamnose 3,5-epimerase
MRFTDAAIDGALIVELEPAADERGMFARTYCEEVFAQRGLVTHWPQCNTSFNKRAGTLRGLHYQAEPYPETKLVRCTRGAAFDVAVDIRPQSPTFKRWFATELSADNRRMVYLPGGVAHGFQALVDETELFYQMSEFYRPDYARGVRWDDPALGIAWPLANPLLSERDRNFTGLK